MTGTVLNARVFEFPTGPGPFVEGQLSNYEIVDDLPDVLVLPETLLALELQLQESSVDLREVSAIILGDLGATIQILRLCGQEYGAVEGRPVRIEDCISDMGLKACLGAVASGTMIRGNSQRAVHELWNHSREIAQHSRALAEEMSGPISPDQAYLAGLLHAIGALPAVLGWTSSDIASHRAFSALRLSQRWSLPAYVKDFFCEMCMPGYHPYWSMIMAEAHNRALESQESCPLNDFPVCTSA